MNSLKHKLYATPCKIAYLGGSVTVQKNGYRSHLHQLICNETQQAHQAINAGIGGVGSIVHAFLLNDFVLKHHPDFCFVECAIVDGEGMTPNRYIRKSLESICQGLSSQEIPFSFLYLFKNKSIKFYKSVINSYYAPVAQERQIHVINMQNNFEKLISHGIYKANDIVYDQIHTTEFGSKLTADEIFKQWSNQLNNLNPFRFESISHPSDSSLFPQIIGADCLAKNITGPFQTRRFKLTIPYLEIPTHSSLNYSIKNGEVVGVLVLADNESGVMEISTSQHTHRAQIHEQWCDSARIQAVLIPDKMCLDNHFSIKLSQQSKTYAGANLHHHPWEHQGRNLKIIGLMINSSQSQKKFQYLW